MVNRKYSTAELLRDLFAGTAYATGDEFFKALARQLAVALQVRVVFVSELVEKGVSARTLAIWANGDFAENLEYRLEGTPCERVLGGEIVQIDERLYELYPSEEDFLGTRFESYLGIPLLGQSRRPIGHVVAMDTKPMVEEGRDFTTFELFAVRATAELERRRAEQALRQAQAQLVQSERMAVVGQLTAGVAHELNTPLGVLKSSVDLVARSVGKLRAELSGTLASGNPELEKILLAMAHSADNGRKAGERVGEIVENLKRFTRIDRADYVEGDIHEGIESAIALLQPSLDKSKRIVRRYGDIPMIRGYFSEINQAFLTLLRNACEAIADDGTVTVTTSSDEDNVYATIADDGAGIPRDELSRLFEVGFSTKGSRVGMRIGLSTAYHVIRRHHGDILVNSSPGAGAEFTIRLPIHPAFGESDS